MVIVRKVLVAELIGVTVRSLKVTCSRLAISVRRRNSSRPLPPRAKIKTKIRSSSLQIAGCRIARRGVSGDFLPPPPPAEKATACNLVPRIRDLFFARNIQLPRLGVIPTRVRDSINSIWDRKSAMRWHTSSASSSSVSIVEDIIRLIAANERAAFGEMLAHKLRGRELPDHEMRRFVVNTWHAFLKHGWPRD